TLELSAIGEPELMRFVRAIRKGGASDTTLRKHLRQLSPFFMAAVPTYIERSPLTPAFVRDLRLEPAAKGTPPFTDVELPKLWAQMHALGYPDVFVTVAKVASTTGLRLGELIALNWDDVRLGQETISVRRIWDWREGPVKPKDGDERTVHLIP